MWKAAAIELSGRRALWKKVKEKESTSRLRAGIEGKNGKLLIDIVEVKANGAFQWVARSWGKRGTYGVGREGDCGKAIEWDYGRGDQGSYSETEEGQRCWSVWYTGRNVEGQRWHSSEMVAHNLQYGVWVRKPPRGWQKAMIVAIHKKGSKKLRMECQADSGELWKPCKGTTGQGESGRWTDKSALRCGRE